MPGNTKKLIKKITTAFKNAPHPGNENIASCDYGDGQITKWAFEGLLWKDVTLEFIIFERQKSPFSFMTPSAIKYYLPAYMIAVLVDTEEADTAFDNLLYVLENPNEIYKSFSENQKKVIREFLEYFIQNPYDSFSKKDAEKALCFWAK